LLTTSAFAQSVAFVGKDSNPDDDFTFVALHDIPNSTVIFFTNREWDNTTGSFKIDGEGTLVFTATSLIPRGTVTLIVEPNATPDMFTVQSDSGSGLGVGLGTAVIATGSAAWSPTSADPHYAFTASNQLDPFNTITEIHALMSTLSGGFAASFDPTTGTGSSPSAVVVNYSASQSTGIDYNADRSVATAATLADETNYLAGASLVLDTTFFSSAGLPVELQSFEIE
jgi:hypothetical protein